MSRVWHGRGRWWVTGAGIMLLWLATHPYLGILWDAQYYTVQALHFLMPSRYADDLFFAYGSQDQFTLFSRLYGPLIAGLGLESANLTLTLIGQGLWLGGALYLASGLVKGRNIFLALVGVILFSGPSGMVYHYAEPILTPRIFAEAMTLWAMGDLWRGHRWRSLVFLVGGLIVHPLMVLPGLASWFLWGMGHRLSGWIGLMLVCMGVVGLVMAGVQPFVRLGQTFDPVWWDIVRRRTSYGFIGLWGSGEWPLVLYTLLQGGWVLQFQVDRMRHWVGMALLVGVGGIVISALGGDLLRNVLVIDAQLWRAIWISGVMVHMSVVPRYLVLWHRTTWRSHALYWWTAALLVGVLAEWHAGLYLLALPMGGVAMLLEYWEQRTSRVGRGIVVACEVFLAGVFIRTAWVFMQVLQHNESTTQYWLNGVLPQCILICATLFWVIWGWKKPLSPMVLWPVPVLLVFGLYFWDQRSDWVRYMDGVTAAPGELTALLPQHRSIYWEGDLNAPWIMLRRANYFSCSQGTGSLFSRETALHYQHLYEEFQQLDTAEFFPGTYCAPAPGASTPPGKDRIQAVCRANPQLGALVLLHPVSGMSQTIWDAPVPFFYDQVEGRVTRRVMTRRFYVVSCPG